MNTNKTPQWEIRFEDFYFNEEYDGSAAEIKAFIKSTLEEVIEKIDKNMEQASGGGSWRRVWIQTKAQLRKEFGL